MSAKRVFSFRLSEFLLTVIVILSGVMLAFSSGGFVVNFKTAGFALLSSLQSGVHFAAKGIGGTVGSVHELAKLRKDYDALTRRLENYEQMRRTNADIMKENERLKEQLGFALSLAEKNYPAEIIARDTDSVYAFLTINKGSAAGVKKNMPVIAYQNGNSGLVGKVVQVAPFTSIIMPVYNLDCIISARIQNTRDLGLVSGNGSAERPLSMQYIRKRLIDQLHFGDIVVTSGENNNYMRDIPLGTISKISVQDYNSSLAIEIVPIIDFARLENVVVVNMKEQNDRRKEK
ncbi:MAG: rod shape-determining protein MreC [Treponema sp.]